MGSITSGYAGFNCSSTCPGGVRRVWVANEDDIASITYGTGNAISAYVMNATKVFYEIKLKVNTKQLTENIEVSEDGCTQSVTQNFVGVGSCPDQAARDFLVEMAQQSCCGMVVIVELNNGQVKTFGWLEDLHARLGGGTNIDTGANLTDANQFNLELVCTSTIEGLATAYESGVAGIPV